MIRLKSSSFFPLRHSRRYPNPPDVPIALSAMLRGMEELAASLSLP